MQDRRRVRDHEHEAQQGNSTSLLTMVMIDDFARSLTARTTKPGK
jgi:hypothetical protein